MEDLYLQQTSKTPEINLKKNGLLEIRGNSYIENTKEFYEPVVNWLLEYVNNPAEKTVVNFDFDYFNTSSQLWIFRIAEVLLDLVKLDKDIEFNWYYKEEEVEEAGEDLANLLGLEMNYIKKTV